MPYSQRQESCLHRNDKELCLLHKGKSCARLFSFCDCEPAYRSYPVHLLSLRAQRGNLPITTLRLSLLRLPRSCLPRNDKEPCLIRKDKSRASLTKERVVLVYSPFVIANLPAAATLYTFCHCERACRRQAHSHHKSEGLLLRLPRSCLPRNDK